MPRSPRPSRAIRLGVVSALAALSIGAGRSSAQSVGALPNRIPVASDTVAAVIAEASRRFGVPESWIRSIMRVESAGDVRAVSRTGAIGLMQVMPATYAELRVRYGLGADPFVVRDNILAGAAYLREMHDRYGVEGMLAAYNAGPSRWEAYVGAGRRLPRETIGYLAQLAPAVGASIANMPAVDATLRTSELPRPTLFVQIGSVSAAASVQVERSALGPPMIAQPISIEPLDSVFVQRHASENSSADAGPRAPGRTPTIPAPPPVNPLFVPVRTSPTHT